MYGYNRAGKPAPRGEFGGKRNWRVGIATAITNSMGQMDAATTATRRRAPVHILDLSKSDVVDGNGNEIDGSYIAVVPQQGGYYSHKDSAARGAASLSQASPYSMTVRYHIDDAQMFVDGKGAPTADDFGIEAFQDPTFRDFGQTSDTLVHAIGAEDEFGYEAFRIPTFSREFGTQVESSMVHESPVPPYHVDPGGFAPGYVDPDPAFNSAPGVNPGGPTADPTGDDYDTDDPTWDAFGAEDYNVVFLKLRADEDKLIEIRQSIEKLPASQREQVLPAWHKKFSALQEALVKHTQDWAARAPYYTPTPESMAYHAAPQSSEDTVFGEYNPSPPGLWESKHGGFRPSDWPWYVAFSEYNWRDGSWTRYNVPTSSYAVAESWAKVYEQGNDKKKIGTYQNPSRGATILLPMENPATFGAVEGEMRDVIGDLESGDAMANDAFGAATLTSRGWTKLGGDQYSRKIGSLVYDIEPNPRAPGSLQVLVWGGPAHYRNFVGGFATPTEAANYAENADNRSRHENMAEAGAAFGAAYWDGDGWEGDESAVHEIAMAGTSPQGDSVGADVLVMPERSSNFWPLALVAAGVSWLALRSR
jgi:hypothetical protein